MIMTTNPYPKNLSSETVNVSEATPTNSNAGSYNQEPGGLNGPVAILWDIENCPVPSDVRPDDVAGNIRMALRVHPVINGAVTMFSAYGDFNSFPRRLREGCQRTGVKLIDVPNGRKDAADKAILVDMFLFALDNRPPSSILLISGDVDFAPALHILGQRGYTVILVIPAGVGVSSALSNAGRFVWDWPSVARGEGFVPPKAFISRCPDISGYLMGCHLSDTPDVQIDEEAIVYRGISQSDCNARTNVNQVYCVNASHHVSRDVSRTSHSMSEYTSNTVTLPCFPSSRSQSLPSGLNEGCPCPSEPVELQDAKRFVQPGDVQGLKGQLVMLLELSGGSLALVRLPSEYHKLFGRPLYVAEYGACKLVNLLRKMSDVMTVEGKGNRKSICLRNKLGPTVPRKEKDKKGKGAQDDNMAGCVNAACSSDEYSDDERANEQEERNIEAVPGPNNEIDSHLECFRTELQELLVSYSCKILLGKFEELYMQRYKKSLNYGSFGVNNLEELIYKVKDVVVLYEDQGGTRKFLVAAV
ncbi:hypothetical protein ACLOJK_038480 [Asimina triloba]